MINLQHILLQAGGAGSTINLFLLPAMFLVMYFFLLRPQIRKQKKEKAYSEGVKIGDRIITKGGIHGKIVRMDEGSSVVLQIDKNTNIVVEKSFISMEMSQARYGQEEAPAKA